MQTHAARSQLAHKLEDARPAREAVIFHKPLAAAAAAPANLFPQVPRLLRLVANSSLSSRRVSGETAVADRFHRRSDEMTRVASCEGVWCR